MSKQVEDFFAKEGMHIKKMIDRKADNGYPYLSDGQIHKAAEALYQRIQGGLLIKPINYASYVYRLAKEMDGNLWDKRQRLVEDSAQIILEKDDRIKMLDTERKFYRNGLIKLQRRLKLEHRIFFILLACGAIALAVWRTWNLW